MSELVIDVTRLREAATGVRNASDAVSIPTAALSAAGCQSATVETAVSDFNMWANITAQTLKTRLASAAQAADDAATAYETTEAAIAAEA